MENVLNGHGLSLGYANDPQRIGNLDQNAIFEDLAEGACDALVFRPQRWRLADHDHVVLARAQRTGRHLGLLAASMEHCGDIAFLNIDTCFIAPAAQGLDLFQRMLSVVMLRMEGMDAAPSVISAGPGSPECLYALRTLAGRLAGAVLFPQSDSPVITLATVALARRIARQIAPRRDVSVATGRLAEAHKRVMAVLDLRACAPSDIIETARTTCRKRPSRSALRAAFGEPAAARRVAKG